VVGAVVVVVVLQENSRGKEIPVVFSSIILPLTAADVMVMVLVVGLVLVVAS